MDFYSSSACRRTRARPRSSGPTGGWRGGITRASIRVTARAEAMFQRIVRSLRDAGRSGPAAAVRLAAPRRRRAGRSRRRSCSRSSISRWRGRGAQASTFTELFAEVLHPVPRPTSGAPEPGADIHAALTLSFADAVHGVERQVLVTRQVPVRRVRRRGAAGDARRSVRAVPAAPARSAGRAGTWCSRSRARRAAAPAGRRAQRCAACAGHGRTVRSEAVTVRDARRRRRRRAAAPARARARRAQRRPAGDLYVTVHVQPHPFFRREGDDLVRASCRWRCTRRRSARASTCRRSKGRSSCGFRRARRRASASAFAGAACRAPRGGRGDLLFEVGSSCRRRSTSDRGS